MADRIEREIEEILRKADDLPAEKSRQQRAHKQNRPARTSRPKPNGNSLKWLTSINMRTVMIWALFAVIVAFFLRGIPGGLGYFLLIGAIIVFVTAFFLSTRGGGSAGSSTPEKRWRGQPLDLSEPGWPDKVKAWWKSRNRR